jgi:diguanylate cyclase (GGDEF)-like protein/putative nucleotidyltransferase with HDIG domain
LTFVQSKVKFMSQKQNKREMSIRLTMVVVFVVMTIVITSLLSYLIFYGWRLSTLDNIKGAADTINTQIHEKVDNFLEVPFNINEVNGMLIENGIVDLKDETDRQKFFVSVLSSQTENIYGFSYGNQKGEYYGARRNTEGELEIIINNAGTLGHCWYYSVKEDLTADRMVSHSDAYDPRTREWYKTAYQSGQPIFSQVYRHFILPDITISAAWPVHDNMGEIIGVLATHIMLSDLDDLLKDVAAVNNGFALIIEQNTGELVANSLGIENFKILYDGKLDRTKIDELQNPIIREAYAHYSAAQEASFSQQGEDESFYLNFRKYSTSGADWLVISAVPESFLMQNMNESFKSTILGVIGLFLLYLAIYLLVTRKLVEPVGDLIFAAEKISGGDLNQRVPIVRNDELGRISIAFNKMADTISRMINDLDQTVQERTAKLKSVNESLVKSQEEIKYLSCHDSLTGLQNRRCLEEKLQLIDTEDNLPISILFADLNGLKMANDIFGHAAGDELIKKVAEVLKNVSGTANIVGRIGGDEFLIVLPRTGGEEAFRVKNTIIDEISKVRVLALQASIAVGYETKTASSAAIADIITSAEDFMYREKSMQRRNMSSNTVNSLIHSLHELSPREKEHSLNVSGLSRRLAEAMHLDEAETKRIEEAAYLHDIGKIAFNESFLNGRKLISAEEEKTIRQHSVIGYRIMNLFDDTLDLAAGIYSHHESWDGSGYPKGLKGEEIPKSARIIAIAEVYDALTSSYREKRLSSEKAISEIRSLSGKRFDPGIVEAFVAMMSGGN